MINEFGAIGGICPPYILPDLGSNPTDYMASYPPQYNVPHSHVKYIFLNSSFLIKAKLVNYWRLKQR
jgi:hypothetical protein